MTSPTVVVPEFLVDIPDPAAIGFGASFPDPSCAALSGGRLIVVRQDARFTLIPGGPDHDASGMAIVAKIYSADGTPLGEEFQVNTTTPGAQSDPEVVVLANGGFVISWTDASATGGDTSGLAVRAQVFDVNANPVGSEVLVNTITNLDQEAAKIVPLDGGGFAILWIDASGTEGNVVRAQRFDAAGNRVGGEFELDLQVATDPTDFSIAPLSNGGFAVAWSTVEQIGGVATTQAFQQLLSADLQRAGPAGLITPEDGGTAGRPTISAIGNGGYVVFWDGFDVVDGLFFNSLHAQIFDANGDEVSFEFLIGTDVGPSHQGGEATPLADGGFLVTWTGFSTILGDDDSTAILGQAFSADGFPTGEVFRISATTAGLQQGSTATLLGNGSIAVFWSDSSQSPDHPVTRALRGSIISFGGGVTIIGKPPAERLDGTDFGDRIEGRGGSDTINGFIGDDTLIGDNGRDQISGGDDNDLIRGNRGADLLIGGHGNDAILGGAGNDVIEGSEGNNSLQGGAGRDTITGGIDDDTISGDGGQDSLDGGDGDDLIDGGAGADTISGGFGNDHIFGNALESLNPQGTPSPGNQSGDDRLFGQEGNDTIEGGKGADSILGGDGDDSILGQGGSDRLSGEDGNDFISGGQGRDSLFGGSGADILEGGALADLIRGGDSTDILKGGGGRDVLIGDAGSDDLFGGNGADVFKFLDIIDSPFSNPDSIEDFSLFDGDRINLVQIDANTNLAGNQTFVFIGAAGFSGSGGELRFEIGSGETVVSGDVDGDQQADFEVLVQGELTFAASDFLL